MLIDKNLMVSTIEMPQFRYLKLGDVHPRSSGFVTEHPGIHSVLEIAS